MRERIQLAAGFFGLVLIAAIVTDFNDFLRQKHIESLPLTEVTWTITQRRTGLQIEVDKCPWEDFGRLRVALDCRQKVLDSI